MKKTILFTLLAFMAITSIAAPRPAMVKLPGIWTIDTEFENLRPIMWSEDGETTHRYWYIILSLTNNSDLTVPFYPSIELMTDTFCSVEANDFPTAALFKSIKLANQGKYPFLMSYDEIENSVNRGSDNTVDIAVIFKDFDPKAKSLSVFVEGLSNETATLEHPSDKDSDGNPVVVRLRKTLKINYKTPGDNTAKSSRSLVFDSLEWVMR